MDNILNQKVGVLVARNYRAAGIFSKYGIDFCCGGHQTLSIVLPSAPAEAESLQQELLALLNETPKDQDDFTLWSITALSDYIVDTHHHYVRTNSPVLTAFLEKLQRVHGFKHPELIKICELFIASITALEAHMIKEEQVLFPFLKQLEKADALHIEIDRPIFHSVRNPIERMRLEHLTEGDRFKEIASLSNNYVPPADACTTYKVTYAMLEDFERDLQKHIHLENNILFPKGISLEAKLWPSLTT